MEVSRHDVVVRGAAAGMVAGLIVAAWFLVVDLAAGAPLATPEALSVALFGRAPGGRVAAALLYSVLHFGTFVLLGMLAALALAAIGAAPGWLVGLVFGVGVLNAVHYVGLLVADARVLTVLPWPHVVGANLVAGLGLMTYLHRATGERRALGFATLRGHPVLTRGLVTGLMGAVAVAMWFFLVDIARGDPLRTPAALGSALFLGAGGPSEVVVDAGIVAAYTIVHLLGFACAGIAFVAVARQVERSPGLGYLVVMAFIVIEAVSFGALVALGDWIIGGLSLWAVGVGNLLGVAAMAVWIFRTHPALRTAPDAERSPSAA